ncbi:MAG: hypothetical protein H6711_28965 [Myxococcales bacterium]|nr:hypothetical protein [Myxococcales bacterium]
MVVEEREEAVDEATGEAILVVDRPQRLPELGEEGAGGQRWREDRRDPAEALADLDQRVVTGGEPVDRPGRRVTSRLGARRGGPTVGLGVLGDRLLLRGTL